VACDSFTVDSLWLTRHYVYFLIEIGSRRVHMCGITTNPTGEWVTQQARNLAANHEDSGPVVRHIVRDRDAKLTGPFDDVWPRYRRQRHPHPGESPQRQRVRGAMDRLGPS
jgi:hypothetical protein